MVPVGKHLRLQRQERPPAVHQIDARKLAAGGDLLRPEVFLDGERVVGPPLHGGVVRHHHHEPSRNRSHPGDEARRRSGRVVAVETGERSDFEEGRSRIGEALDPLPDEELPLFPVAGARPASPAFARGGEPLPQILAEFPVMPFVGPELVGSGRDAGLEPGQQSVLKRPGF